MTYHEKKELAVSIIQKEFAKRNIFIKEIVFFGDQNEYNPQPDSHWDFLISIENEIASLKKTEIINTIQNKLSEDSISADIFVKSESSLVQI